MTPKEEARNLIDSFYYMLPNNGYLDYGINSCNSRYKEGVKCAIKCVEKIIEALDFSKENQFIIANHWEYVLQELKDMQKEEEDL